MKNTTYKVTKQIQHPLNKTMRKELANKLQNDAMRLEMRYQTALSKNDTKTVNSLFNRLNYMWDKITKLSK